MVVELIRIMSTWAGQCPVHASGNVADEPVMQGRPPVDQAALHPPSLRCSVQPLIEAASFRHSRGILVQSQVAHRLTFRLLIMFVV